MSKPLTGIRVLVVDDDEDARDLFATVLEIAGADVRPVGDGEQALAAVDGWSPKVVLSDLILVGHDGATVVHELRAKLAQSKLPAIAVTGRASPTDREKVLASGFQHLVAKPVDPKLLVDVVVEWSRWGE